VVERKWARSTLTQEYLGGRRIHRFTPILTQRLIITANAIDGVVAYDRHDLSLRWRLPIRDGVEPSAQLVDDTIYFGASDGQLYAVNVDTGRVLWTYPLKAEGIARPLVRDEVVYVLGGNNVAHALHAKTGKLIWLYNRREGANLSIRGGAQPAIAGDAVFFGFSDGSLVALSRGSGSLIWEASLSRNRRFRDVDATPIVDGDSIFISSYDGALYALSRSDGKVLWSVDEGGYDEVLVHNNTLFYSSSGGKTMALDKASGKVLWTQVNPNGIGTTPVLYKGAIAVGEMDGALRFLDARTGEFLGMFEPGRGVTSKAAVDTKRGEVFFMSTEANLFALKVYWTRNPREWPWQ